MLRYCVRVCNRGLQKSLNGSRSFQTVERRRWCSVDKGLPSTSRDAGSISKTVVEQLRSRGHAVQSSAASLPIGVLVDLEVPSELIVDLFVTRPDLIRIPAHLWKSKLALLQQIGMNTDDALVTLANNLKVFEMDEREILLTLDTISSMGIKGNRLPGLIQKCPEILTDLTRKQLQTAFNNLGNFFTSTERANLIGRFPEVLFRDFSELEAKYEYIYYEMGIESAGFKRSARWVRDSLDHIIGRHEFAVRTGAYLKPDPKRPLLTKTNPKLHDILDTNDATFAQKICAVSLEEYLVFKDMFERQNKMNKLMEYEEEGEEEEGEEGDGKKEVLMSPRRLMEEEHELDAWTARKERRRKTALKKRGLYKHEEE